MLKSFCVPVDFTSPPPSVLRSYRSYEGQESVVFLLELGYNKLCHCERSSGEVEESQPFDGLMRFLHSAASVEMTEEWKNMDEKQHDINQNRLYGAISYLWILCFVPLIWRRESHFAQHHARQGLALLIAEFFGMLISWIPFFGFFLSMLIGLILAILALLGIINALDGKYWQMPIIGHFAKKIRI